MTEEEWMTVGSPGTMLWQVETQTRKLNLFASACLRRVWHLLPGAQCREAVETLERYADGEATAEDLAAVRHAAREEGYAVETGGHQHPSVHAAMAASYDLPELIAEFAAEATAWVKVGTEEAVSTPEEKAQAELARDIFGNPFRPVSFDPAWRTSTVVALAQQMYDSRDFSAMPILGDALQDAGCGHGDILDHCRSAGPHVRGCWVVDLVLGKE